MRKKPLYTKRYLEIKTEDNDFCTSDVKLVADALENEFGKIALYPNAAAELYPLFRDSQGKITVTLTYNGFCWEVVRIESMDTSNSCYALAVDYGSTSITMELIDTLSGKSSASETITNPQTVFGDEILSRIFYTKDNSDHCKEIQKLSLGALDTLIDRCEAASGIKRKEYAGMVISANTTMVHFLLGLSAWPIFSAPYRPIMTVFPFVRAVDLELDLPGYIFFSPAAANYLGGDILSGLLTTDIDKNDELSVFLDIGTNGELIIGNREFLIAGAGAAGPAFESGVSSKGMRAAASAIDRIEIKDNVLSYHTIGSVAPEGICGSGIVSLISELFINGWIDGKGTFEPQKSERIKKITVLEDDREEYAIYYAYSGETKENCDLYFSQSDIYTFLQTKAAAHTMVDSLLGYAGISIADIGKFYLAGALGTYVSVEDGVNIGMYPDIGRDKFKRSGNTSLKGSIMILCDSDNINRLNDILSNITYIQFGEVTDFVENMRKSLFLPHTDIFLYPSVAKKLEKNKSESATNR